MASRGGTAVSGCGMGTKGHEPMCSEEGQGKSRPKRVGDWKKTNEQQDTAACWEWGDEARRRPKAGGEKINAKGKGTGEWGGIAMGGYRAHEPEQEEATWFRAQNKRKFAGKGKLSKRKHRVRENEGVLKNKS